MIYSRSQVNRAGKMLMSGKTVYEVDAALEIINAWRTSHLHPLKVLKNSILRELEKIGVVPVLVSQRLKRLSSIEYKLDLNPSMALALMQDIGGYRVVVRNIDDLQKLKHSLKNSAKKHKLERVVDYVEIPKESGYRSIHFIYTYHSRVKKYSGLKIELQIRTKLQHNWATAVETAGLLTNTSLKSSQGPDEWLDFFKVTSSLFAIKEKKPVLRKHSEKTMQSLMKNCYIYCKEMNIISTLKALRLSTQKIESDNFPGEYYLININLNEKIVRITTYTKSKFNQATDDYLRMEKNIIGKKSAVVLVSANSIKSLKKAYPSYFLDTSEFIDALEKINRNCIHLNLI